MLACYAMSQFIVEQLLTILHSIIHACKLSNLSSLSNGLHHCRVDSLSSGLWNRVVKRTNYHLGSGIGLLSWTSCQLGLEQGCQSDMSDGICDCCSGRGV